VKIWGRKTGLAVVAAARRPGGGGEGSWGRGNQGDALAKPG